jgi:hypothetical protein
LRDWRREGLIGLFYTDVEELSEYDECKEVHEDSIDKMNCDVKDVIASWVIFPKIVIEG